MKEVLNAKKIFGIFTNKFSTSIPSDFTTAEKTATHDSCRFKKLNNFDDDSERLNFFIFPNTSLSRLVKPSEAIFSARDVDNKLT